MAKYIDKSALVAEIDDMLNTKEHTSHCDEDSFNSGRWKALTKVKGFLDTLEVKEVDLEKEFFDWYHEEKNKDYNASILYERYGIISKKLAKHFYELGLKAKGE